MPNCCPSAGKSTLWRGRRRTSPTTSSASACSKSGSGAPPASRPSAALASARCSPSSSAIKHLTHAQPDHRQRGPRMPKSKAVGVTSPLRSNPEFLADCKSDMRKKDIMAKWGASSGLVVNVRKELAGPLDEARMKLSAAEQAIKHDKMIREYVDDRHDPVNGSSYTRMADTAWGEDDWREFLRQHGTDPDSVLFSHGVTSRPDGGYWNKLNNVRPKKPSEGG